MLTKAFDIWYSVLKGCLTFVFECSLRHADWWVHRGRTRIKVDAISSLMCRMQPQAPGYRAASLFCTCPLCGGFCCLSVVHWTGGGWGGVGGGELCFDLECQLCPWRYGFCGWRTNSRESERNVWTKAHEDICETKSKHSTMRKNGLTN